MAEQSNQSPLAALGEPTVQQLTDHSVAHWYLDREILHVFITGISRAGTDAFADIMITHFNRRMDAGKAAYYLVEIRADLTLTPYFHQRADELVGRLSGIEGYGAYIFEGNVLMRIAKPLILLTQRRLFPRVTTQTFKHTDAALLWLYKHWQATNGTADKPTASTEG